MPEGDVTPSDTIHVRPIERVSKHRPYMTVGASPGTPASKKGQTSAEPKETDTADKPKQATRPGS